MAENFSKRHCRRLAEEKANASLRNFNFNTIGSTDNEIQNENATSLDINSDIDENRCTNDQSFLYNRSDSLDLSSAEESSDNEEECSFIDDAQNASAEDHLLKLQLGRWVLRHGISTIPVK